MPATPTPDYVTQRDDDRLTTRTGDPITLRQLSTFAHNAFVDFLRNQSAITAIVGTGANSRIRPDVLSQNEPLEAIRYEIMSTERMRALNGVAHLWRSRIQIDCYGNTRAEANTLGDAVIDALDGYRGIVAGLYWRDVAIENEYDATDPPSPGSETWRRRKTLDCQIVFDAV